MCKRQISGYASKSGIQQIRNIYIQYSISILCIWCMLVPTTQQTAVLQFWRSNPLKTRPCLLGFYILNIPKRSHVAAQKMDHELWPWTTFQSFAKNPSFVNIGWNPLGLSSCCVLIQWSRQNKNIDIDKFYIVHVYIYNIYVCIWMCINTDLHVALFMKCLENSSLCVRKPTVHTYLFVIPFFEITGNILSCLCCVLRYRWEDRHVWSDRWTWCSLDRLGMEGTRVSALKMLVLGLDDHMPV